MRIVLIIGLIFLFVNSFAQNTIYPKGCYMNIKELRSKKPSQFFEAELKIKYIDGSDTPTYRLKKKDSTVKKKFFRNKVFAYCDGDDIFLNGRHLWIKVDYCKVINRGGKYLMVYGGAKRIYLTLAALTTGMIGSCIMGSKIDHLYYFNTTNQRMKPLRRKSMCKFLKKYPNLLLKYKTEKKVDQKNAYVMRWYIDEVNSIEK